MRISTRFTVVFNVPDDAELERHFLSQIRSDWSKTYNGATVHAYSKTDTVFNSCDTEAGESVLDACIRGLNE